MIEQRLKNGTLPCLKDKTQLQDTLRSTRVKRHSIRLCLNKTNHISPHGNRRAICPWKEVADYKFNRDPQILHKAQCDCREECLSINPTARCREFERPIQVRVNKGNGWENEVEMVPVGCFCGFNNY